jgi:hypothetical protein
MTFALLETIQDDTDEGTSKIEKLIVPLALCGCMGSGQQNPIAGGGGAGGTSVPTCVPDNSGQQFMQVLLLSHFLRRRPSYSSKKHVDQD